MMRFLAGRKIFLSVLGILLFVHPGCAPVKPLPPRLEPQGEGVPQQVLCAPLHPPGAMQYTHAITFRTGDGRGSSLIGVTVIRAGEVRCALLTLEGFTLFSARQGKELVVERAVPPFDRPGFARGLLADVQALFLPPEGEVMTGLTPEGEPLCRYTTEDGRVTDLGGAPGCRRRLTGFDRQGRLARTIRVLRCRTLKGRTIPAELVVEVPGSAGYRLQLQLLEAVPIDLPRRP